MRVALAYPDLYDLGMSNLGLGILYDIVNRRPDALAERVFSALGRTFEDLLRAHRRAAALAGDAPRAARLRPARHLLSYEVCFTNVLNLLELGGIPIRSADRSEDDPIVLAGGSAASSRSRWRPSSTPSPSGEGEELIDELVDFVRE